jgi:hypothetical protein
MTKDQLLGLVQMLCFFDKHQNKCEEVKLQKIAVLPMYLQLVYLAMHLGKDCALGPQHLTIPSHLDLLVRNT